MKRDLEFDEPIAERIIEGTDCTVTVQLGPPRRGPGDTSWYCPYRIKGIPDKPDLQMYGAGEDAVAAIIYALANIGAGLNYQEKDRLGLNWFGVEHLGFLDALTLPWGKLTPEEDQAGNAIIDVWSNPTSTPEERQAIIDKFFQQQRESRTD